MFFYSRRGGIKRFTERNNLKSIVQNSHEVMDIKGKIKATPVEIYAKIHKSFFLIDFKFYSCLFTIIAPARESAFSLPSMSSIIERAKRKLVPGP